MLTLESPPVDNDEIERDGNQENQEIFVVRVVREHVQELRTTLGQSCSHAVDFE